MTHRIYTAWLVIGYSLLLVGLTAYVTTRYGGQSANELLRAGFTIVDPEGRKVERFDGIDYWTTTP